MKQLAEKKKAWLEAKAGYERNKGEMKAQERMEALQEIINLGRKYKRAYLSAEKRLVDAEVSRINDVP